MLFLIYGDLMGLVWFAGTLAFFCSASPHRSRHRDVIDLYPRSILCIVVHIIKILAFLNIPSSPLP